MSIHEAAVARKRADERARLREFIARTNGITATEGETA